MAKTIINDRQMSGNIHLLQRKYLGNGRFYQRGLFKGAEIGDTFESHTHPKINLMVDKILSVSDSKSAEISQEQAKNAHIEMELIFNGFINEDLFMPLRPNNYGN